MQSLLAERDKAFRAQAFNLKQLNTRVVQLQHQQTEQASREAALLQELSLGSIEGQHSTAESLVAANEHGSISSTLKRVQSRLSPSMETMRRRLEPIMSSGELSQSCESGHLWHSKCARHLSSLSAQPCSWRMHSGDIRDSVPQQILYTCASLLGCCVQYAWTVCMVWLVAVPGSAMQDSSLVAGLSEDEEDFKQEPAVKLMLVVLGKDAIQGFYQQVCLLSCIPSAPCQQQS